MRAHTSLLRRLGLSCVLVALVGVASVAGSGVAVASFTSAPAASHSVATSSCFHRATVQSGTTTSTTNGLTIVTIASVNTAKAFLLFSTRHDSNRPVGSEVSGRIASATTLEFNRVTDESSPVTITIQWDVILYNCGVTVQRGSTSQNATIVDVSITAVNSIAAAFVTYSKTPAQTDGSWGDNDPQIAELTSTTNLELRVDNINATSLHTIYWQVIEFTSPSLINVQKGTTSLTGGASSTTATLGTSVNTAHTVVLASTRSTGTGTDIGSGLVRAVAVPPIKPAICDGCCASCI